ncbi:His-Xaa-Ser system protein HxsD [Pantoea coffeiphila]|nr:His-Xaa-Ser system protein HxsD [Pantoea coffeiphila]
MRAVDMLKNIRKTEYSEWVVRNSLYWMSAITHWQLDGDDRDWIVSFKLSNDEVEFEFERLLNDYKLREQLQVHTDAVRTAIIDNVLRSIDSRLAQ